MDRIITRTNPIRQAIPTAKKVVAYARVSCEKDAMLQSLAAQVDFYRNQILDHAGWVFVGVYADVGKPYGQKPKACEGRSFLGFTGFLLLFLKPSAQPAIIGSRTRKILALVIRVNPITQFDWILSDSKAQVFFD